MPQCLEASGIAPVASCLVSSEQSLLPRGNTPASLGARAFDNLQINWADHLDIARCCEAIAEYDLGEGIAAMGGSLALLSHELLMAELQAVAEVGNSPAEKVGRLLTFT